MAFLWLRALIGILLSFHVWAKELSEPDGEDVHITVRNIRCLASCLSTPEWEHHNEPNEKSGLAETLVVESEDDWRQPYRYREKSWLSRKSSLSLTFR